MSTFEAHDSPHVAENPNIVYAIYYIYNARNRHRNDKRIVTPRNDNVNFSTATSFPVTIALILGSPTPRKWFGSDDDELSNLYRSDF